MEWIELQPTTMEATTIRARYPGSDALARQLHGWLRHKLKGLARSWCKDKDPADGIETWRAMLETYDPTTGASLLDLQAKICRVERIKSFKELPESVDKWEKRYKKYRAKVGKELDDLTRQNILLQMLPPKWEQKMRFQMHTRGRETVYATLRHELLDLAINVAGPMAIGMDLDDISPEGANGIYSTTWFESLPDELREMLIDHENNGDDDDDDEDLDALRKGGGKKGGGRKGGGRDDKGAGRKGQGRDAKGQGRDAKPRCDVCNKPGHLKADCWSNPNSKVFKGEEFRNKVLKSAKNIGEDDGAGRWGPVERAWGPGARRMFPGSCAVHVRRL